MTLFNDFEVYLPCATIVDICLDTFCLFLTWPLTASPFCSPLRKENQVSLLRLLLS